MIIRPSFSGLYQAGLDLNADAEAYIDAVQANDSFTFSKAQKIAISDFFNALVTAGIEDKILNLHFYGANAAVGLRNAMSPDTVIASWTSTPSAADFKDGYLEISGGGSGWLGSFNQNYTEIGLSPNDIGNFITVTGVPQATSMYWMSAYNGTHNNLQLKQDGGELAVRLSSTVKKGQDEVGSAIDDPARNGVFIGSRTGYWSPNTITLNRTNTHGTLIKTHSAGGGAGVPPQDVGMLSATTLVCNISLMGITLGLTQAQATDLGDALFDCAIAMGHTAIGTT